MKIPDDLKDTLELVRTGWVNIGGKFAVDLIERIATLEHELSQARASIASYDAGKDNLLRTIAALGDEARAAAEAMGRPVSDEEIFAHRSHATNGGYGHKDGLLDKSAITALIAARVRDSKSKSAPARADEASK
jgi:hypothetical protein